MEARAWYPKHSKDERNCKGWSFYPLAQHASGETEFRGSAFPNGQHLSMVAQHVLAKRVRVSGTFSAA